MARRTARRRASRRRRTLSEYVGKWKRGNVGSMVLFEPRRLLNKRRKDEGDDSVICPSKQRISQEDRGIAIVPVSVSN